MEFVDSDDDVNGDSSLSSDVEGSESKDSSISGGAEKSGFKLLLARTKQKAKRKRKKKDESGSEGGEEGTTSGLSLHHFIDAEAEEDFSNVGFEHDYEGISLDEDDDDVSGDDDLMDSQAVEDNHNLEFEHDFDGERGSSGEDSSQGSESEGEDLGESDGEDDFKDDLDYTSSEDSFIADDDSVEYTSEGGSLDELDELAEAVRYQKRRRAHFLDTSSDMEVDGGKEPSDETLEGQPKDRRKTRKTTGDSKRDSDRIHHPNHSEDQVSDSDQSGDESGDESGEESSLESGQFSNASTGEPEGSVDLNSEQEEQEGNSLQWKSNLLKKAADSFLHRQQTKINLHKLVYEPHLLHLRKAPGQDDNQGDQEEIGGIFRTRLPKTDAKDQLDVNPLPKAVHHDWSSEDVIAAVKELMVTGKWDPGEDAQTLLDQDEDGEVYGDFEDLETGETFQGQNQTHKDEEGDEQAKEGLLEKKRQLKENFDKMYDDKEGGETNYFSDLKASLSRQAELNRAEFEGLDERLRMEMKGVEPGTYVRLEVTNVPCEFIQHLNPAVPVIVGGLLPGEMKFGYISVRIKRHRWYKRLLKSRDPLILSIGWRRIQTVPVYFKREDNMRQRYLKYTPEHLHCHATLYAPQTAPGTGFIGVQSVKDSMVRVCMYIIARDIYMLS